MKERIESIQYNIDKAMKKASRNDAVSLMAVSKNHPYTAVEEALTHHITLFGENKVQELSEKFPLHHPNLTLHMIGHLQSNKVKKVVPFIDSIDSVDSIKLARMIDKEASKIDKNLEILLEINTSKEDAKSGFLDIQEVYRLLDLSPQLPQLKFKGLLTIGPLGNNTNAIKESFSTLKEIQSDLMTRYPSLPLATLSMGMSSDYDTAVKMGATHVRVGSALFGERDYTKP